jgi:DNA repair protein RadA/Sms
VDLNGQIRPVAGHVIREGQALRLGYTPIICPVHSDKGGDKEQRAGFRTLTDIQKALFSRKKSEC